MSILMPMLLWFCVGAALSTAWWLWYRRCIHAEYERRRLAAEAESDRLRLRVSSLHAVDGQADDLQLELTKARAEVARMPKVDGELKGLRLQAALVPELENQIESLRARAEDADRLEKQLRELEQAKQDPPSDPVIGLRADEVDHHATDGSIQSADQGRPLAGEVNQARRLRTMTPEDFRKAGHELIDWIADYRTGLAEGPVLAEAGPGQVAAAMSPSPPETVIGMAAMLAELDRVVLPGLTQVQHPMHFGWFPSNASLSSVLGDIASSGIGSLGISWESCPALTEVEEVVCEWMRQLTGLSDAWSGTIQDTASTACLVALISARERATNLSLAAGGMPSVDRPPVVYTTDQAHSSVRKAALMAGFGADNLRTITVSQSDYSMDVAALREAIASDVVAGRCPAAVVVSVGTTGTTAIDPVADIVELAQANDMWVHVDAAMAGTAMLLPEYRHLWTGVEGADSITWNPHKWMGTILDTSLYYVRDVEHLVRVMSTNPSYLMSTSDGAVTQYRDWGLPLGRRFRALKLWFQLELDGIDQIRDRIRRDLANAAWLADRVTETEGWELVAPVPFQTVCVRHRPPGLSSDALDTHTLEWVRAINQSGRAYLTPSVLDGEWMVRVSIGVESTERSHVEEVWALMQRAVAGASG